MIVNAHIVVARSMLPAEMMKNMEAERLQNKMVNVFRKFLLKFSVFCFCFGAINFWLWIETCQFANDFFLYFFIHFVSSSMKFIQKMNKFKYVTHGFYHFVCYL